MSSIYAPEDADEANEMLVDRVWASVPPVYINHDDRNNVT